MAKKELVTEADVRRMAPGGELVLGPSRIATPAALDAAFAQGIRVVHVAAGAASAAPQGQAGGAGLMGRMKQQDGTYIVEVRGGRAVVTRLGPNGPEPFGSD
ncbi:MAG: hypothetical protein R3F49_09420 [Planctomycetota bacterium]